MFYHYFNFGQRKLACQRCAKILWIIHQQHHQTKITSAYQQSGVTL